MKNVFMRHATEVALAVGVGAISTVAAVDYFDETETRQSCLEQAEIDHALKKPYAQRHFEECLLIPE